MLFYAYPGSPRSFDYERALVMAADPASQLRWYEQLLTEARAKQRVHGTDTGDEQRRLQKLIDAVTKPLDTQVSPVLLQDTPSSVIGVEVAGQVVDTAKYKYDRIKVRGPDGVARYTASCKDAVAKSLLGMSKEELFATATANGLKLETHFKLRNSGHFRMIVGQSLRNLITKGGHITIKGVRITDLKQSIGWPEGYSQEKKGTTAVPIRKQVSAYRKTD